MAAHSCRGEPGSALQRAGVRRAGCRKQAHAAQRGQAGEPAAEWPTRLGNAIAAFEQYSDNRYGLDAIFYWPRIWINLRMGSEFSYPKLTRLRAGDFVYPKLMAWEGAFGVVPPCCDGCVVSPEFPVFEINEDRILPEVVDVYFQDSSRWDELAGSSTGTNVRRMRLHPKEFLSYRMSVPPMPIQKQIRAVYDVVRQTRAIRKRSAEELGAILPAILNRAFNGRL